MSGSVTAQRILSTANGYGSWGAQMCTNLLCALRKADPDIAVFKFLYGAILIYTLYTYCTVYSAGNRKCKSRNL